MTTPTLSTTYALEDAAEALRTVQLNQHVGKAGAGVRCLAPADGLGVADPELRARIGEDRIADFRRSAQPIGG